MVQLIERIDKGVFRPIAVCLQKFVKCSLWDNLDCEKCILNVYSLLSIDGLLKLVRFARFLKNNRVDIIQTFFFDSTVYGIIAAKMAGINNTVSCRRDMGFWYDDGLKKKMRIVNRFTRRVLVNSNAIKSFVSVEERLPEAKIDVIHNGIDLGLVNRTAGAELELLAGKVRKEDIIVGIVGNFNRRIKRFDLFVRAAREVVKRHRKVKFLVVGGGALKEELKNLASELRVVEEIIFVGKMENAIPYIKCFDIGILSSDSEGFPNVLLEYMACGVPAVATCVGGNVELIKDRVSGLLVPKGDHVALAKAICELIEQAELREWLKEKAREMVAERYSWDKKIQEIQSYYLKLVGS